MRFSLIDLLMAIAFITFGCIAVSLVMPFVGHVPSSSGGIEILGVCLGGLLYIIFTPAIYRRFRLLPLFLPVCPHCKRRPAGYRILESVWPRVRVACGRCEQTIELWWRPPAAADVSKTMPSLLLSWPH